MNYTVGIPVRGEAMRVSTSVELGALHFWRVDIAGLSSASIDLSVFAPFGARWAAPELTLVAVPAKPPRVDRIDGLMLAKSGDGTRSQDSSGYRNDSEVRLPSGDVAGISVASVTITRERGARADG